MDVIVGEHDASSGEDGTRHTVCGTTSHPKYDANTTNYDFAIVRLSKPVELGSRAVPACLPDAETFGEDALVGKTLTVSGWGRTIYQGSQSVVLKTIDVPGISNKDCQEDYRHYGEDTITDAMLCAESAPRGEDGGVCQGDSGGKIMNKCTRK